MPGGGGGMFKLRFDWYIRGWSAEGSTGVSPGYWCVGSPWAQSIVGIHGPGVSVFGLPYTNVPYSTYHFTGEHWCCALRYSMSSVHLCPGLNSSTV